MFVLKNKLTVGFLLIVYKNTKRERKKTNLIMLINIQNQFHTLSQILDQNDNNELIKNLSHILDQINNSNIYFIISVKNDLFALSYSIIRSFEIN